MMDTDWADQDVTLGGVPADAAQRWLPKDAPHNLAHERQRIQEGLAAADKAFDAGPSSAAPAPGVGEAPHRRGAASSSRTGQDIALRALRRTTVQQQQANNTAAAGLPLKPRRRDAGSQPLHSRVHDSEAMAHSMLSLKKEVAGLREENKLLRVSKEKVEAELRRAEYDGDQALRSGAIVDAVAMGGKSESHLIKQLKAKARELSTQLQAAEGRLADVSGGQKGVRVRELEVQTKIYLEEARRLRELFELQAAEREDAEAMLREIHARALATKEQQLADVRLEQARLRKQNTVLDDELGRWLDENEMLRDQMQKLESAHESGPPAPPTEAEKLRTRLKESQASLRRAQKDKERIEADKVAIFNEMHEAMQKMEAELKAEKGRCRKAEKMHKQASNDLALANAQLLRAGRPAVAIPAPGPGGAARPVKG